MIAMTQLCSALCSLSQDSMKILGIDCLMGNTKSQLFGSPACRMVHKLALCLVCSSTAFCATSKLSAVTSRYTLIYRRIGYKKTYMIALIIMTGAIFLPFFADGSIPILMAGQVISGVPWVCYVLIDRTDTDYIGHVPNSLGRLCVRDLSSLSQRATDNIRQHLLGHWPNLSHRSASGST